MRTYSPLSASSTWTLLVLGVALLAVTLQGVQGEAEQEGPSESECRPYIEKALKELEAGGEGTQAADSQETQTQVDTEHDSSDSHETDATGQGPEEIEVPSAEDDRNEQAESEVEALQSDENNSVEASEIVEELVSELDAQTEDSTEGKESQEAQQNEDQSISQEIIEEPSDNTEETHSGEEANADEEVHTEEDTKDENSKEAQDHDESTEGQNENESIESDTDSEKQSTEDKAEESIETQQESHETQEEEVREDTGETQSAEQTEGDQSKEEGDETDKESGENEQKSEEAPVVTETEPEESEEVAQSDDVAHSVEETVFEEIVEELEAKEEDESKEGQEESKEGQEESKEVQEESKEAQDESKEEIVTEPDEESGKQEEDSKQEDDQKDDSKSEEDGSKQHDDNKDDNKSEEDGGNQEEENKQEAESVDVSKETETDKDADGETLSRIVRSVPIADRSEETHEEADKDSKEEDQKEETKEDAPQEEAASKEGDDVSVEGAPESESKEGGSEEKSESEETGEEAPEEELTQADEKPDEVRVRDHVEQLLKLDEESSETENILNRVSEITLRELKKLYESAIKPLETLYKYRDLSNRHFGDAEIFSKPLILFMGPWSGGKSSIINYLLDNEYSETSLRTGAEPSPAYFNILMYGEEFEVIDGTQLAADFTFSGLQKFGQGLEERLRGIKIPSKLLEKVNIVEIPGILEVRKIISRVFPFNDACQWFIDRADIIFLVYDPSKLDVGPETEAILDQLKGREHQTRIILNKADQVKPEELMRVQGALIWNISPLMSSAQPPVMYTTSLWSRPFESWAPVRLLQAQERAFLRDLRHAVDKRIENKIASARRFAVRVRNHAKMVDCYLTTYYNHKSVFGNKKQVADQIIEHPQDYHIYEGLSTLTNISRYDLPDPDVYRDFFKLNPLYEFQQLSATCTYFRGCPINRLDVAIAYDLPELIGKHRKLVESALGEVNQQQTAPGS